MSDPLSPARGIKNGVLLSVPIWAVIIALGVALAGQDDRKSPAALPPLPIKERSCLRVYNKPRCIPVSSEVLKLFGFKSGQYVTPLTMLEIDEENRKFLRTKLR
jgi:hypothetical protein